MSHASSASFFENNSSHGDGHGTDQKIQNANFGKNVDKAVFGSDLAKSKQETRIIRSRILSKEKIDYHLLMALAFHDLPIKKSNQLSSLLGAVVKRCMDPTYHNKFQVKKMHADSHDSGTVNIRGVNSIINALPNPKVISYNQFACIELNETINHMLDHGYELKSLDINSDTD